MMENPVRNEQEKLFRDLLLTYKGTPMAVSSESLAHKELRYSRLIELFSADDNFSVHDIGMGMCDFYKYMTKQLPDKQFTYSGTEILPEYIDESKKLFPNLNFYLRDIAEKAFEDNYDYLVMSGIFHQKRNASIRDWEKFALNLIANSFAMSKKAIAFNFVSPFVDFYQPQVYYSNIYKLITFINDSLSRFFTIHHNYALFEFTVFIYREEFIKQRYIQPEFQKYFKI